MRPILLLLGATFVLSGCETPNNDIFGNPIVEIDDSSLDDVPTADDSIQRSETEDQDAGNGFLRSYVYDAESDTLFVEGLAFDGNQPDGDRYARATQINNLPGFQAYEAPDIFPDSLTDIPIFQFQHRALYAQSESGLTELAIARTGNYIPYGFGGYIYQREDGFVIPEEGQAAYVGDYAALRDFQGDGGLEYATGTMSVEIDFSGFREACDPECDNAVRGFVVDRRILDLNGNDITQGYIDALSAANDDVALTQMPVITFEVGPGSFSDNGQLDGTIFTQSFEADLEAGLGVGTYEAIMAGDHGSQPGGEIVGITKFEVADPRFEDITVRETGGFILERLQDD